ARAFSPPAMASSTHLPPASLNALANSLTAADSPPDVHQCSTSAVSSCAVAGATARAAAADTPSSIPTNARFMASSHWIRSETILLFAAMAIDCHGVLYRPL